MKGHFVVVVGVVVVSSAIMRISLCVRVCVCDDVQRKHWTRCARAGVENAVQVYGICLHVYALFLLPQAVLEA